MAKKQKAKDVTDAPPSSEPNEKLPVTTRNFVHPDTYDTMTIVHDPNAGTYTETVKSKANGKETTTIHAGISHAWARWKEIPAK
jgi:hypothetical protein